VSPSFPARIAIRLVALAVTAVVAVGVLFAAFGVRKASDVVEEHTAPTRTAPPQHTAPTRQAARTQRSAPTQADVIQCINKNKQAQRSARLPAELVRDRCRRRYESDVTTEVQLGGELIYGLFCGDLSNQSHDWIVTRVSVKIRYQTLSFDGEIANAWLRPQDSSYLCATFPEHRGPPIIDTALSSEQWGWEVSAVYGVRLDSK
jgi:hypothetical protein